MSQYVTLALGVIAFAVVIAATIKYYKRYKAQKKDDKAKGVEKPKDSIMS